jgi:hypothetical protein
VSISKLASLGKKHTIFQHISNKVYNTLVVFGENSSMEAFFSTQSYAPSHVGATPMLGNETTSENLLDMLMIFIT